MRRIIMKVSDLAKKTIKSKLPKQYNDSNKKLTHQLRKTSTKRCKYGKQKIV